MSTVRAQVLPQLQLGVTHEMPFGRAKLQLQGMRQGIQSTVDAGTALKVPQRRGCGRCCGSRDYQWQCGHIDHRCGKRGVHRGHIHCRDHNQHLLILHDLDADDLGACSEQRATSFGARLQDLPQEVRRRGLLQSARILPQREIHLRAVQRHLQHQAAT